MDDEFALCWNNFQENIASGFQNLLDRGDLVDVTLACDGKLLHAHKIVLAICSPYFQEMFNTNPCKHPIIILKDVAFGVMCELLQFMYQGVVNVKHAELPTFMKIAQTLQIKGLATNSIAIPTTSSASTTSSAHSSANPQPQEKSPSHVQNTNSGNNSSKTSSQQQSSRGNGDNNNTDASATNTTLKNEPLPITTTSTASSAPVSYPPMKSSPDSAVSIGSSLKRLSDFSTDSLSIYPTRKLYRRNADNSENDINNDSMDQMGSEDVFLPPIPQISMVESRFDINNVKREHSEHPGSPGSIRSGPGSSASSVSGMPPSFSAFDYNSYSAAAAAKHIEYPNDLHMPSDYSKNNFANHMDIPPIAPGERWFQGKLEFMLSQRGKPLLVHDGHTFGIQYVRKDKKYWQCNLSRKFNCKARVTTTDTGEIIVTNNEHCHTEIRQHLRKDYQRNKVMMNAFLNLRAQNHMAEEFRRVAVAAAANNSFINQCQNNNNGDFCLKDFSNKFKKSPSNGNDVEEHEDSCSEGEGNGVKNSPTGGGSSTNWRTNRYESP